MTADAKREVGTGLRLALDFGPLLVFFLANSLAPVGDEARIYVATGAFMLATAAAMLVSRIKLGRVSPMLWFSGAMVLVFGGLTLWLHQKAFIQVKPTAYYFIAAALLFFGLKTGRPTLQLVLGSAYPGLNETGWRLLTRNWAFFFVAMAFANEVVRHIASFDFWVGYKLWGALPATLIFAFANMPMLMKHGMSGDAAEEQAPPPQG